MPHMELRYSRNLEDHTDVQALCEAVAEMMRNDPMFVPGGIRVRAVPVDAYVIADGDARNAFLDMVLRIGSGRTDGAKKATGEKLFNGVVEHLSVLFMQPYFALSFELLEIDAELSWKKNSIHSRLR
jgi:5-carboxymethyl-2-hydroxymuconate isomerase